MTSSYTNQLSRTPDLRWNRVFSGAASYTFWRLSEPLLNTSEPDGNELPGCIQGPSGSTSSPEEGGLDWTHVSDIISALPFDSSSRQEAASLCVLLNGSILISKFDS